MKSEKHIGKTCIWCLSLVKFGGQRNQNRVGEANSCAQFFGTLYYLRVVVEEGTPLRRGHSLKKKKTLTRRKGQGHTSILNSNNEDNKNSVGRWEARTVYTDCHFNRGNQKYMGQPFTNTDTRCKIHRPYLGHFYTHIFFFLNEGLDISKATAVSLLDFNSAAESGLSRIGNLGTHSS